jgi:hypothetical protein
VRKEIFIIASIGLLCGCMGCAGVTPRYDTNGNIVGADAYGFLRDVTIYQKKADGSEIKFETKSTSADVMKAGNEILGTMVNGASKMMP